MWWLLRGIHVTGGRRLALRRLSKSSSTSGSKGIGPEFLFCCSLNSSTRRRATVYDLAPAIFLEKNGLELVKGEKKIFCNTQFSQHNGTFVFFHSRLLRLIWIFFTQETTVIILVIVICCCSTYNNIILSSRRRNNQYFGRLERQIYTY